jgi:long-subunit acyl-CoA synthetase (AMP-forming)
MFDPKKPPATLGELVHRAVATSADSPCLGVKIKGGTTYEYSSYKQVAARVQNAACGLLQLGLQRGERAAILAENRPEWAIADLACQMIGVISVPLFSTLPSAQVKGILEDCGAALVFVSNAAQLKKMTPFTPNYRRCNTSSAWTKSKASKASRIWKPSESSTRTRILANTKAPGLPQNQRRRYHYLHQRYDRHTQRCNAQSSQHHL